MRFPHLVSFCVISIFGLTLASGAAFARETSNAPELGSGDLPSGSHVVEDIVARVNDRIITNSDYQRAKQQLEQEGLRDGLSPDAVDAREKNLLRDLIDQQLLLSKGKQLGITGETGMVKRLDAIRKANHLKSMEALEKAAEAQHVSFEDFKASIRNSVITQRVVQQEVSPHITMSPDEVQQYYNSHKDQFLQPESIELSEILIPTSENPDAAALAKAKAKAGEVEAKLKNGADFAKLAKTASGGPTAAQGGALGRFHHGMMAPELEAKTFSLKAGQFTEPIRTKQGYVILEVTQHTAAGEESFEKVRPQVEEAIFMQKMQPALRKYLTKLREQAYVDIEPGLVDTGASPNEIQMSYSAYTVPGKKKKEKFERVRFRGRHRGRTKAVAAAAPAKPATHSAASAEKQRKIEEAESKSEQKPGKKEKIRFGQAPRESLPAASADVETSSTAGSAPAPVNPDVHYVNPNGVAQQQKAQPEEKKTRFGSRDPFHFHLDNKKEKKAEQGPLLPPPTPVELETRKIQDQAFGLGDHILSKKGKKKSTGKKTRLARETQKHEKIQQPYMNGQQPVSAQQAAKDAESEASGSTK